MNLFQGGSGSQDQDFSDAGKEPGTKKSFVPFPGAGHQAFPLELMIPAIRRFLEEAASVSAHS